MCERGILPVSPSSNSTVMRSPSSSRPSKPVGGGVGSGKATDRQAAPGSGSVQWCRTQASEPHSPCGGMGSPVQPPGMQACAPSLPRPSPK